MQNPIQSDIYDYSHFLEDIASDGVPVDGDKLLVIQSDADFECQSLQACIWVDATGPTVEDIVAGEHLPGLYVDIENTGNGQKWTDNPVGIPALFGTGQNPFILPVTYIMERNAAFRITVTNDSGYALKRVTFTFSGRKLFL